ncbi:MAG: DUF1858 domain-containing protein [Firmicutes bacterium]|nr:DUF1858 domain-containing protein [Bacillota bacterium]
MTIDVDRPIAEILEKNPKAAEVFLRFGMHCLGCIAASGETVRQAAEVHGIDLEELQRELAKL